MLWNNEIGLKYAEEHKNFAKKLAQGGKML